jgi:hypothetical protein
VSYDSGVTDYHFGYNINGAGGSSNGAGFYLSANGGSLGNGTNEITNMIFNIYNPSAATYTHVTMVGSLADTGANIDSMVYAGARYSAAAVDAIQVIMSTGNITSGTFKLYGQLPS